MPQSAAKLQRKAKQQEIKRNKERETRKEKLALEGLDEVSLAHMQRLQHPTHDYLGERVETTRSKRTGQTRTRVVHEFTLRPTGKNYRNKTKAA